MVEGAFVLSPHLAAASRQKDSIVDGAHSGTTTAR